VILRHIRPVIGVPPLRAEPHFAPRRCLICGDATQWLVCETCRLVLESERSILGEPANGRCVTSPVAEAQEGIAVPSRPGHRIPPKRVVSA